MISSTKGSISEIMQEGIIGFTVDTKFLEEIADKIMTLINAPKL